MILNNCLEEFASMYVLGSVLEIKTALSWEKDISHIYSL